MRKGVVSEDPSSYHLSCWHGLIASNVYLIYIRIAYNSARELNKDYTPVEECVHSGDGADLLKASILLTQSKGVR